MRRHPYAATLPHPENNRPAPPVTFPAPVALPRQDFGNLWLFGAVLASAIVAVWLVGLLAVSWIRTGNHGSASQTSPPAQAPKATKAPAKKQRPACCGTSQPCPSRLCFGDFQE